MDTQIQNIIGWLVGLISTSVITGIIGVYSIIKAGKMLPKDLKSADLDNKIKDLSLSEKYELLAEKSAEKAIGLQARLNEYEQVQLKLSIGQEELQRQIEQQNETIGKQDKIIDTLICEIENYKIYTNALIAQIKEAQLVPVDMESLKVSDCNGNGKAALDEYAKTRKKKTTKAK